MICLGERFSLLCERGMLLAHPEGKTYFAGFYPVDFACCLLLPSVWRESHQDLGHKREAR